MVQFFLSPLYRWWIKFFSGINGTAFYVGFFISESLYLLIGWWNLSSNFDWLFISQKQLKGSKMEKPFHVYPRKFWCIIGRYSYIQILTLTAVTDDISPNTNLLYIFVRNYDGAKCSSQAQREMLDSSVPGGRGDVLGGSAVPSFFHDDASTVMDFENEMQIMGWDGNNDDSIFHPVDLSLKQCCGVYPQRFLIFWRKFRILT